MQRNARTSVWFWVFLVLAITVGLSAIIAVTTHDDACRTADSPKSWVIFPPHWECKSSF